MKNRLVALAALAAVSAPAFAAAPPSDKEARIVFPAYGGVRDFEADGREAVYLQDRGRNWYLARLIGPCENLPWANRIGIDSRGGSSVDRFSTLLVDGQRCPIQSLTHSSGPPPKKPHRRHAS